MRYQSAESVAPIIEALLFASDEPLSAQELRALILGEEAPDPSLRNPESLEEPPFALNPEIEVAVGPEELAPDNGAPSVNGAPSEKKRKRKPLLELSIIHEAVQILNDAYEATGRAFRLIEIAGGYQFATRSEFGEYVARLFREKSRRRLSGAALETLAIVAYKQPVSKNDIENIRGVNCDEVLKSLLEKNLVTITGRAETVGRPLLYGTTLDFLRHFGLPRIQDLPRPREIEELMKEESVRATTLEEAATEFVSPDFAASESDITVDEAIAVAKELGERERDILSDEVDVSLEEEVGIGLDFAELERNSSMETNGRN
ncbi:MAG TPA: SMC-Scp complex subunit ScpB [Candidatus Kapabacteria bacterium]|nr:SMC-Scp complex subunit ScpB [Candidatus Kapabacteria bacterium]